MIPLKDTIPSKTFPFVTIILILINFYIFFYQIALGNNMLNFINSYAVIPKNFQRLNILTFNNSLKTLFTSCFLHGSFIHLLGNMLYLWIFGDNVENKFGHIKFIFFYFLCAIISVIAQVLINPVSSIPIIGASGAIAGILGAYFIFFPKSKIVTLVPIFFFFKIIEIPAILFLGFWFVIQFLSGTSSSYLHSMAETGGVAWWAHIGGFVCGVIIGIFAKKN